jgi:hypothetical protein
MHKLPLYRLRLCKWLRDHFLRHRAEYTACFNGYHSYIYEIIKYNFSRLCVLEEVKFRAKVVSVTLAKVSSSKEYYISNVGCKPGVFFLCYSEISKRC